MKRSRRNHSATFKAKVALTAIKDEQTLAQLAERCASKPDHAVEGRAVAARGRGLRQGRPQARAGAGSEGAARQDRPIGAGE